MGYMLEVRDAAGKVLASAPLEREFERQLPTHDDTRFPLLRFLDEYGDTYFNTLQAKALLGELEDLASILGDGPAVEIGIEAIRDTAVRASAEPHQFLVFVGD